MFRCPRLQTLSSYSTSKRPLVLFNKVLFKNRLLKAGCGTTGKTFTLGCLQSPVLSTPLSPGEERASAKAGEPLRHHQDNSLLCREAVSTSHSLCLPQCHSFVSGEKLCTETLSLFMTSDSWNFFDCLVWKNAEDALRAISNKNLSSKKCREEDNHSSTKESNKVLVCNVKNYSKKSWLSHNNLSPRWTTTESMVTGHTLCQKASQVRCLHHGATAAASTPPNKVGFRECLSAQNEARCRHTLEPNMSLYRKDHQNIWAAVLVSLCQVEGEPAFLFTLRSSTLKGRHKGDVRKCVKAVLAPKCCCMFSFAGGKWDPSDKDVVGTALREAREELGITVKPGSVWGILKPLRDMSGKTVAPVVANLGHLEELSFHPNPAEVEEIFTISVSHLCSQENRCYTHFRSIGNRCYTLPVFCNGKHRVWGLTAVALDHALRLIVPQ